MPTPAEIELAKQAAMQATVLPPGTSALSGQTPAQAAYTAQTSADIAADQGGPVGMVTPPQGGFPMATDIKVTKGPAQDVDNTTKQLDPRAVEADRRLEEANKAYLAAQNMPIPIEKVAPMLSPQELEEMKAKGQTEVTYGQFGDIHKNYETKLKLGAEQKAEAERGRSLAALEDRMAKAHAESEAKWAEVAKKASPAEMFVQPSVGSKIVQAIALGLSTYAHIRMGHSGPSPVQQMIQQELDRDYAQRREALKASLEAAEKAGAKPAQLMATYKLQSEVDKERQIAQLKYVGFKAEEMGNIYPTKAREAAMIAAEYQKKAADESRKLFADKLTSEKKVHDEGQQITQTHADKQEDPNKGKGKPTDAEQKMALHARRMERAIESMEGLPQPSDKALEIIQDNENKMMAAINSAKTLPGAWKLNMTRWLDENAGTNLAPRTQGKGISDSDQVYNNNMITINQDVLRIFSGAAIRDEEAASQAEQMILRAGDSPGLRQHKLKEIKALKDDMKKLSGQAGRLLWTDENPTQTQAAPSSAPVPVGDLPKKWNKPKTGQDLGKAWSSLSKDDKEAADAAMKLKPGDPKYVRANNWLHEKGLR